MTVNEAGSGRTSTRTGSDRGDVFAGGQMPPATDWIWMQYVTTLPGSVGTVTERPVVEFETGEAHAALLAMWRR